ncbi:biotin--[acetyl-CoA-carboxylase] ligase [Roseivirga sp. UBA838]|uniref:biotin--[acetyl-CoA-carboxylase] ligase n=1 Tax=Roseivirga sp. UBA838 TaxID=1947393 RepID=UPI00257BB87D|nr:biotin--[acetyl-CoA-carboxylase] ligase [Roseivirga sp. UBA838]|tara:strand:- start:37663 stop:38373 length:711 start_codon:yes stop_codon:yes gene_type:complete
MPSCHSTNDSARELLQNTATTEGAVIVTDEQTKGKGQRGNAWLTNPGENLTLSLVLKPSFLRLAQQFYLNMISSLAVRDTISGLLPGAVVVVKWPNDVYLNGKKVSGILIENSLKKEVLDNSIVGIGLNVNQQKWSLEGAVSLSTVAGHQFALSLVFERLLECLEAYYLKLKAGKYEEIKQLYLQHLLGYRQRRKYRSEVVFDGIIEDVTDAGLLKMRTSGGTEYFDFKAIEFIWN